MNFSLGSCRDTELIQEKERYVYQVLVEAMNFYKLKLGVRRFWIFFLNFFYFVSITMSNIFFVNLDIVWSMQEKKI